MMKKEKYLEFINNQIMDHMFSEYYDYIFVKNEIYYA